MKEAKAIQICGTGSGVGKSVISCALCRILLQDGYSVAPFKSQNMALNSFVTKDGGEIGRAQAVQAYASKIKPTVDMNPILIKPTSNTRAQIILLGKPVGNMDVYGYKDYKKLVFDRVKESLKKLKNKYEVIVIEGAGSPAEINLKSHDLVNMRIAKLAKAPVVLVGDIDKGGVFAWLIGTLELLTEEERRMIKGFIINKFRGDKRLLTSGINFLERYTGIKVLGVIPYFRDIKIPEEDSLSVKPRMRTSVLKRTIKIDVIYLPHISNFTDFDALEQEPDVALRYVNKCRDLDKPDVIIIPGTKNTIEDLGYLKKCGLAKKIVSIFRSWPSVILTGICGGYQILGERIYDRKNIESKRIKTKGLDILPVVTEICPEKILSQVRGRHLPSGIEIAGYEIHQGRTKITRNISSMFEIIQLKNKKEVNPVRDKTLSHTTPTLRRRLRGKQMSDVPMDIGTISNGVKKYDGAITDDERCWGTYIHGIFDSDSFRRHFLNNVRKKKGWRPLSIVRSYHVDKEIDKLADLVRRNIDLDLLYKILFARRGK